MQLLRIVWKHSGRVFFLCTIASLTYAGASLVLLSVIAPRIGSHQAPATAWRTFLGVALLGVAGQVAMNLTTNRVILGLSSQLRATLIEHITATRLIALERAGSSRVYTILYEDTAQVARALPGAVGLLRDSVFIVACLGYLAWLSPSLAAMTLTLLLTCVLVYRPLQKRGRHYSRRVAEHGERAAQLFRNLIDGIKEIKLNSQRRDRMRRALQDNLSLMSRSGERASAYFSLAIAVSTLGFFLLLGMAGYGVLERLASAPIASTASVLMIFMLGPVIGMAFASQTLTGASVALNRIEQLCAELTILDAEHWIDVPAASAPAQPVNDTDTCLEAVEIVHTYHSHQRQPFRLGPISLVVRPGEVLFVTGGNGSGKTTLGKLLAGLYVPDCGELRLAGELISNESRAQYRQQCASIFSDYCLFEALAEGGDERYAHEAPELLRWLKLDQAVDPGIGLLTQARTFSSGERKRVALFVAYLEARLIYLFDEFAADQDPDCKELFYREILPDLKARGRIVIVITHDSRYFSQADLLLTLDRGMPPELHRSGESGWVVGRPAAATAESAAAPATVLVNRAKLTAARPGNDHWRDAT